MTTRAKWAGAIGYLVGEENRGLEYMFIMMNAARYDVGMQGIVVSERAYQHAVNYAKDRIQSRPVDGSAKESVAIIHHPDVKRMLMTMRALIEGARGMVSGGRCRLRQRTLQPQQGRSEEGSGFLRIPGAADQGFLDRKLGGSDLAGRASARWHGLHRRNRCSPVLPRFAHSADLRRHHRHSGNDLVGRKTARDGGAVAKAVAAQIADLEGQLAARGDACKKYAAQLKAGRESFLQVVDFVLANVKSNPNAVFAGSVSYLMLAANLVSGWQMGAP